jgi:hypothetical protein
MPSPVASQCGSQPYRRGQLDRPAASVRIAFQLGQRALRHRRIKGGADLRLGEPGSLARRVHPGSERCPISFFHKNKLADIDIREPVVVYYRGPDVFRTIDMDWKKIVADLIDSGMKQVQIAEHLDVSQSSVSDLATGKTESPNFDLGARLLSLHHSRGLRLQSHGVTALHVAA